MVDFTTLDQNAALSGQHLLKMQTTDACWTRVMNKYVATIGHGRDVRMGRGGGSRPPIFTNLQESWSKVSQAARGFATVCSATSVFS